MNVNDPDVNGFCPKEYLTDAVLEDGLASDSDMEKENTPKKCVEIDCGTIASVKVLHRLFQKEFCLAYWYGCNWDAFNDLKYDIVFPERLVFRHWDVFEKRFPRDAAILRDILQSVPAGRCAVAYD